MDLIGVNWSEWSHHPDIGPRIFPYMHAGIIIIIYSLVPRPFAKNGLGTRLDIIIIICATHAPRIKNFAFDMISYYYPIRLAICAIAQAALKMQ